MEQSPQDSGQGTEFAEIEKNLDSTVRYLIFGWPCEEPRVGYDDSYVTLLTLGIL